jgi:Type IV secretion system pilin
MDAIGELLLTAPAGLGQVVEILEAVRNALVAVLTALAIAALTYAGIRYLIAGGDPGGIEKAKTAAKSAVVGLGLALLAPVLVAIVKGLIGA